MSSISRFSISAYHDLRDAGELTKREAQVFDAIAEHGPMTREEVAAATRMKEGAACGRVNALLHKGVLVEVGCKANPITGKLNGILDLSLAEKAGYTSRINSESAGIVQVAPDLRQVEVAA